MKTPIIFLGGLIFLWGLQVFAYDTVIKGDTMEVIGKGEMVLFSGNVTLVRSSDTIQAQRMESSKNRDRVKARGHVKLTRKMENGGRLTATGQTGFYNTQNGDGLLTGNGKPAHVVVNQVESSSVTRTINVYASQFEFSDVGSTGTAQGQVYGKSIDPDKKHIYEFWSDLADINHLQKFIYLRGEKQPRVHQTLDGGQRNIRGDTIKYDYEKKRFKAIGHASAYFVDSKKKGKN